MNPEEIAGNSGTATTTEPQESVQTQPEPQKPAEQMFTKSEVNDMMRKRVERSHNSFFTRYGVKDLAELDDLISKASSYDEWESRYNELKPQFDDLTNQHHDLTKKYGYKACNIDDKKIQDIETYFKGKGLDINEETLMAELKTHPDWVNKVATIQKIGAEVSMPTEADARAEASRIFGVKL